MSKAHCTTCGELNHEWAECSACREEARVQREMLAPHYEPDGNGNMVIVEDKRIASTMALVNEAWVKLQEVRMQRDQLQLENSDLKALVRDLQTRLKEYES